MQSQSYRLTLRCFLEEEIRLWNKNIWQNTESKMQTATMNRLIVIVKCTIVQSSFKNVITQIIVSTMKRNVRQESIKEKVKHLKYIYRLIAKIVHYTLVHEIQLMIQYNTLSVLLTRFSPSAVFILKKHFLHVTKCKILVSYYVFYLKLPVSNVWDKEDCICEKSSSNIWD